MSIYITQDCINCGACEQSCPTSAISEDPDMHMRVIDPTRCTECVGFYERAMCQIECPVECCLPDPKRMETRAELMHRAKSLFPEEHFHLHVAGHGK